MTLGEIKHYIKIVTKRQAMKQIQFLSSVALGAQGSGKDIKKSIKELQEAVEDK